jgi:RNA recognition motif-containing protein
MINYVDRDNIPHCLFLGDLSAFCTEEILEQIFSPFGKIILLQIARSKKSNIKKHLMFGFLGYDNSTSAANAMKAMEDRSFVGKQ